VGAQVIVIDAHTAKHRILDGHHGPIYSAPLHGLEYVFEGRAGVDVGRFKQLLHGLFAVRTGFALKCNSGGHGMSENA
jgi:hypothetical protein